MMTDKILERIIEGLCNVLFNIRASREDRIDFFLFELRFHTLQLSQRQYGRAYFYNIMCWISDKSDFQDRLPSILSRQRWFINFD